MLWYSDCNYISFGNLDSGSYINNDQALRKKASLLYKKQFPWADARKQKLVWSEAGETNSELIYKEIKDLSLVYDLLNQMTLN